MPKNGYKQNDEHRKKISKSRKGFKMSNEQKEKLRQINLKNPIRYWLGKKRPSPSIETLRKRSESMKGKNTWTKGKTYTLEERKQRSEKLKGEKNHNWQGGKTARHLTIRRGLEYRLWRESVFKRDNYTCVWCGDNRGRNLEADHIKPFAQYPELRFAIDNGRTLCKECHQTTKTFGCKIKSFE